MGRTATPRLRHGPAGLLMALFVVAGLIFSYGLGHGPPPQICTTQIISAPADEAAHHPGPDAPAAHPGPASAAPAVPGHAFFAFTGPWDEPPLSPADACLCLAVLLGLLALVLAAGPRRTGGRTPPRSGWALAPPAIRVPSGPSLSALRVLRL